MAMTEDLESLHEERRRLMRAKRLGQASAADCARLAEIRSRIDEVEATQVVAARSTDDVLRRLEAVDSTLREAEAIIMERLAR